MFETWVLGVTSTCLYMNVHVGKVCSKAFRGLYNIRQIRKFLSMESTKTLVHAFVTSHLDYCNSLLFPDYIADLLLEKPDCSCQLRSNDQGLLLIPKTRAKTLGDRAFAHAGPSTWNKLPYNIRNIKSIENFKSHLKTSF